MLAKVLIVASAAAVDADIVVELIVDDAVAVDETVTMIVCKMSHLWNSTY